MATDITKSIENSLLELQKNAKNQIAKIVNIGVFSEKIYGLILSTLIELEEYHNEVYIKNPESVLEHSCIEFTIASLAEDTNTFSLISISKITNIPTKMSLVSIQDNFNSKYHDIIAECNNNYKIQNFKLSSMEISTFYNQLTMLIKNNTTIRSTISSKANNPTIVTIQLDLEG